MPLSCKRKVKHKCFVWCENMRRLTNRHSVLVAVKLPVFAAIMKCVCKNATVLFLLPAAVSHCNSSCYNSRTGWAPIFRKCKEQTQKFSNITASWLNFGEFNLPSANIVPILADYTFATCFVNRYDSLLDDQKCTPNLDCRVQHITVLCITCFATTREGWNSSDPSQCAERCPNIWL